MAESAKGSPKVSVRTGVVIDDSNKNKKGALSLITRESGMIELDSTKEVGKAGPRSPAPQSGESSMASLSSPPSSPTTFALFVRMMSSSGSPLGLQSNDDEEESEDMKDLEELLSVTETRNELIDRLLFENQAEASRKVRLFFATNVVLETTDRQDRAFKASKMVDIFLKPASRFFVEGIPSGITSPLMQGKLRGFRSLARWILVDLNKNEVVRDLVSKIKADGV